MLFFIQQHKAILALLFASLTPVIGLSAPNSVTVTFEANFYARTCKIDVSEPLIEFLGVHAANIVLSDAGTVNDLNRDISLVLSECSGVGSLGSSSVIVSGNSITVNGESLFKDSGSSEGVGIRLKSNGVAKTDKSSVWDLTSTSAQGNKRIVTAALSCGGCQSIDDIGAGDFQASMTFTVITN